MVQIEILSNGKLLDLESSELTYVKQVSDLGDITKPNSSYSWTTKFPKSPNNVKIFESLGIAGSTSSVPYRKIYCRVIDNGVAITQKSLLKVSETTDVYNVYVQEGLIDFLTDVSVDLIGEILDLTSFVHENTVLNIINSFSTGVDAYKYLVAYFNGPLLANFNDVTNLNPFSLVPAINMQWMLDEIFSYYGWTYSGNFDMSDKWLTYPVALAFDESTASLRLDALNATARIDYDTQAVVRWNTITHDSSYFTIIQPQGNQVRSTRFRAEVNGNYLIAWNLQGYVDFEVFNEFGNFDEQTNFFSQILLNGTIINQGAGSINQSSTPNISQVTLNLQAGDLVEVYIYFYTDNFPQDGNFILTGMTIESSQLQISQLGVSEVDFRDAFIKYKVSDYLKEVMVRYGLTSFADSDLKHIHFMSINERINSEKLNWSDKYIKRVSEGYIYKSYSRNNLVKHKYNEENDDYYDGLLFIDNDNLPQESVLYQSNTYAPAEELVEYNGILNPVYNVTNYPMFEVKVKVATNGDVIADYKPLKGRFYVLKEVASNETIYIDQTLVQGFPLAENSGVVFSQIFNDVYPEFERLLDDTKIIKVELALSRYDVATLDLKKVYYFEQEHGYFLFNKLTYKSGKVAVGEFVRVNYS